MHDHLDLGVREDLRQRGAVQILRERVDDRDPLGSLERLRDRQLHQAQQRPVATLAHELRVEGEPAGRAGTLGQRLQRGAIGAWAHGLAPGSR